jgi:hypothetical protein
MHILQVQRIGLVSCGKEKARSACRARDLFVSDYFRRMRQHVEASCDDWWILSSRHGLVHPGQVLEPYEQTLSGASQQERRAWAARVFDQIRAAVPEPGAVVFEVHAGADYTRELVPRLRAAGYHVENPLAGRPIGERMRWYLANRPAPNVKPVDVGQRAAAPATHSAPPVEAGPRPSMKRSSTGPQSPARAQPRIDARPTSADFERELLTMFRTAVDEGRSFIEIRSSDLHRRVGGYPGTHHAMPVCCNVMRRAMKPTDQVLQQPPSGLGASLLIRYRLPR